MSVPAPTPQGEITHICAASLFLVAGFEAAAGWPLPDGSLPVGGKGLAGEIYLMKPAQWQAYRALCAAERAAQAA